jgi:ElaB/YqjD/DUF883 family membrane-anchored ribosome-binding protein
MGKHLKSLMHCLSGHFADLYYNGAKHVVGELFIAPLPRGLTSALVRFLRAHEFRDRLQGYNSSFLGCRNRIQEMLLAQGSRVEARIEGGVHQVAESQDELKEDIQKLSRSVDAILERLGVATTEDEKDVQACIQDSKGAQTKDEVFDKVVALLSTRLTTTVVTETTRRMASRDLEQLLRETQYSFDRKLDAAQDSLDTIKSMSAAILRQLNGGVFTLIDDPEIKRVWKMSKWGLTVKSRRFGESMYTVTDVQTRRATLTGSL